jgi:Fe-S-cluster-containing dehydrogenase component/anaerobic selenocysteine-containing dehydrogenase
MEMNQDNRPNPLQQPQDFVPPRHWLGPEELEAGYWADPAVQEKRGQEFFEKPVEWLEKIDKTDTDGVARREFLTLMGASMAMAGFACARRPVHKIIPYVVKPEEVTPGVANFYASTLAENGSSLGVLIKVREGRPIKLEGNPEHPLSAGRLSAQGQASLLSLYDPDRLKAPVSRTREGVSKDITWKEADSAIVSRLKKAASKGGQVRILSEVVTSDSTRRLVREVISGFKGQHVEFEPLVLEDLADAQAQSYGSAVMPEYRFADAETVLSLGADFLGTWPNSVAHSQAWSTRRKVDGSKPSRSEQSRLLCFESVFTLTGSNADERYPVRAGDELKIALAIAHELMVIRKVTRYAGDLAVVASLNGYTPDAVAREIGLDGGADVIRQTADRLWKSKGKGIVIGGGVHTRTADAVALQVAVNLLNSALENEGATVDASRSVEAHGSFEALSQLVRDMKAGRVDVLIVHRANPAFSLPASFGFEQAVRKVPTVIVISERIDETALLADYVLPDHHFLENWGDAQPRRGLYSLQQPAIAPIHDSRSFQDSLIAWTKVSGVASGSLAARSDDWHGYLMANWRETVYRESGSPAQFEQFWEGALRVGVLETRSGSKGAARSFKSSSVSAFPRYSASTSDLTLALYASMSMGDGRAANNPWLQEIPDPISTVTWDNYLSIAPSTAKKLGLSDDDVVKVTVGDASVELPINVQPGMHPNSVAAAIGYGRRSVGKVGDGAGVDLMPLTSVGKSGVIYAGQKVSLQKTGKFYRLAKTQWHNVTENRPIINDITLAEFRQDPAAANHTDPHLRLETVPSVWPTHEFKGHRWGMAIDLTSCIGCQACVVACQAENNVPVVGRDQVRVSRQMHWIRIDRYYGGSAERPDVVFQPMLCQHCENAPCETVCPVLATVHDDEGTSQQIYNRCVGTRYCQNNCPYKVRRFNFFDHWKSYEGPMSLVWNPDVTVRTRGIMEKCSFCTQRITAAKDQAKDKGEKLKDGDVRTACQQTCPTDAIIFGDVNDPESRVSKHRNSPQAFRALEILNTKPMVSYLSKVRNKTAKAGPKEGAHGHV